VEKTENGWAEPVNLGSPINTASNEYDEFISSNGLTMVFSSDRDGGYGKRDLYYSENWGGYWAHPVNFGKTINSRDDDFDPWIDFEGDFIIFSTTRKNTDKNTDLWYAFKSKYGWDIPPEPIKEINTSFAEYSPFFIDNTLFFSRFDNTGKIKIMSVKAEIKK